MPAFDAPTILVPDDLDPPSRAAVQRAIELAHGLHGRVVVLHVVPPSAFPEGMRFFPQDSTEPVDLTEYISARARQALDTYFIDVLTAGVEVRYEVRTGHPVETILAAIRDDEADLVVVGTHGRSGLSHILLGSTAERVVRSAPCPVLTVRHPEHEFVTP